MAEVFRYLFAPIQVGTVTVPNRIVATTYSINSGRADGLPDPPYTEHHMQKARGGVGWLGGETWLLSTPLPPGFPEEVWPGGAALRRSAFDHPAFVERAKKFTDQVHSLGAVCSFQITHLQPTMNPSPVNPGLLYDVIPHELEEPEIEAMIDEYVRAAALCQQAGGDFVELHCAHECVPQMFFSPYSNKRTDRWGGSVEGRTRFVTEAVRRIREELGTSINVGLRICADEYKEGGYNLEHMKRMAAYMTQAVSIDYLSVDVGSPWGLPSYVQPMQYPLAAFAYAAGEIRAAVNEGRSEPVPIVYTGRVNDPVLAERLLAEGQCDLVGMTRASIADPEFARKAREGRLDEIRKCIGCNLCIGRVIHDEMPTALCSVNPTVGSELRWAQVKPAATRKRVVVVGGGPGGMEAARVAASRGHQVTLIERNAELGGQLLIAMKAPRREGFVDFSRYQEFQFKRLGVEVKLNTEASAESVLALNPDVVIVATGSVPRVPDNIAGIDSPNVVQGWDVLAGNVQVGDHVVILSEDDHMETPSVADYLASRKKRVEVLHKWLTLGDQVERYTKGIVFYWLYKNGVKIRPSTRIRAIEGNTIVAYNSHTGEEERIEGVDNVVLSLGSQGDSGLYRALNGKVKELYLVGAAFAPRRMVEATQHGANIGAMI